MVGGAVFMKWLDRPFEQQQSTTWSLRNTCRQVQEGEEVKASGPRSSVVSSVGWNVLEWGEACRELRCTRVTTEMV